MSLSYSGVTEISLNKVGLAFKVSRFVALYLFDAEKRSWKACWTLSWKRGRQRIEWLLHTRVIFPDGLTNSCISLDMSDLNAYSAAENGESSMDSLSFAAPSTFTALLASDHLASVARPCFQLLLRSWEHTKQIQKSIGCGRTLPCRVGLYRSV